MHCPLRKDLVSQRNDICFINGMSFHQRQFKTAKPIAGKILGRTQCQAFCLHSQQVKTVRTLGRIDLQDIQQQRTHRHGCRQSLILAQAASIPLSSSQDSRAPAKRSEFPPLGQCTPRLDLPGSRILYNNESPRKHMSATCLRHAFVEDVRALLESAILVARPHDPILEALFCGHENQ